MDAKDVDKAAKDAKVTKKRGRPKGSKNKPHTSLPAPGSQVFTLTSEKGVHTVRGPLTVASAVSRLEKDGTVNEITVGEGKAAEVFSDPKQFFASKRAVLAALGKAL